jgi:hypothetical protein
MRNLPILLDRQFPDNPDEISVNQGDTILHSVRLRGQLVAASKQLGTRDFNGILKWTARGGIKRHPVATDC